MIPRDLVAEVLSITKRPDKELRAYATLNKALRKLSSSTELARDLVEGTIVLEAPTEFVHLLPLSPFVGFRKFCYMRPFGYKAPLQLIVPDNIMDDSCRERIDCYYVAGDNVRVSLSKAVTGINYGYYAFPARVQKDTLEAETPWLCDAADYILIDAVAADIFRNIGDDTSAQAHEADARLSWESLKQDIKWGGLPQCPKV